jgi:hypothetical protein
MTPTNANDPNFNMPMAPPTDHLDSDSLLASYTAPDVANSLSPRSRSESVEVERASTVSAARSPPGTFAAMTMSSTTALLASQLGRRWGNMQKVLDTTVSHDTPAFRFELTGAEAHSVAICVVQGMENEDKDKPENDTPKAKPEIVFLEKRLLPLGFHLLRLTKGEVTDGGTHGCESLEIYTSSFARNWEATAKLNGLPPGTYIVVPVTVNLHVARPFRIGVMSLSDSLDIKPVSVLGLAVHKSQGAVVWAAEYMGQREMQLPEEDDKEEVEINTPFKDLLSL